MKRYFCLIAISLLCSCEKTGYAGDAEHEPENTSTNFSFAGIEYSAEKNDFAEYIVKEDIPFTYNNHTSLELTFVFLPENNMSEVSRFGSDDPRAFASVGIGQKVKIPVSMSDGGILALDDGTRWDYTNGDQRLRPIVPGSGTEFKIPPHHKLTLVPTFTRKALSANYKVYLKGVEFGETYTVEGWWSGLFFVDYSLRHTVEPL